jgi:hypothetical protein
VTVTHSPRGEIVAVKGLQELLAQALKDNPLAAQFAAGNTDEGLKLAMAELFVVFSENAVKPGETWDVEYEVPLPKIGTVKGKKTYKYVGPDKVGERATVKLEVTQSLSVDIDITMGEAKVTGNVSTSQSSGTVQFDPEAGQIVAKKTSHSFSGNLTVVAGGKTIPVQSEQTQEVTVELLDKLPE